MAKVIKIKIDTEIKKPLTSLQKKILNGPVMTNDELKEFKKVNKWVRKWKI